MHRKISKSKIYEKKGPFTSFLTVLISNFHIFIAKLQEQDDVYFECRIVSNPEATKLEWYHEVNFSDKFPSCHIRNYVPLAGAPIVPQCIRRHPSLQSVARYSGNSPSERKLRRAEYQSSHHNSDLQGVEKKHNGAYTCRAENSQGEATSNTINLSIKCKTYMSSIKYQTFGLKNKTKKLIRIGNLK